MPATSRAQRALFCIALAIKRGKTPKNYSKKAAKLAAENSEETLRDFCEPPVKR